VQFHPYTSSKKIRPVPHLPGLVRVPTSLSSSKRTGTSPTSAGKCWSMSYQAQKGHVFFITNSLLCPVQISIHNSFLIIKYILQRTHLWSIVVFFAMIVLVIFWYQLLHEKLAYYRFVEGFVWYFSVCYSTWTSFIQSKVGSHRTCSCLIVTAL
jgi:hypothetical protein